MCSLIVHGSQLNVSQISQVFNRFHNNSKYIDMCDSSGRMLNVMLDGF